jgi:predicted hotdog family 3-hydroxylacyl-ACP dehydratase
MSGEAWPSPVDVLPHRPPMVLLDRVVSHEPARTVCAVDLTAASLFVEEGVAVPAWVGVEYMAQCVAAHAGLMARARGEAVRLGWLIGARRIEFYADRFTLGQTLLITAVHTWGEREMAAFGCSVSDATSNRLLADGVVSVYAPSDGMLSGPGP